MIRNHAIPCRGFTLTEIAVVLSIIGIILGAIWTAANMAYTNYKVEDIKKEIQYFQQQVRTLYSSTSVSDAAGSSSSANWSQDIALTDSCGSTPPCSTSMMIQVGAFLPDFINPSMLVSGASFGQNSLYVTKYGYPVWTGIENSELYAQQDAQCGQGTQSSPPCPAGNTVIELDLFNLTPAICTTLLMQLVNAQIDGLDGISTTENGWGPEIAPYFGNATLPTSIPLSTAAAACGAGGGAFSYDTTPTPQIWMWFRNS